MNAGNQSRRAQVHLMNDLFKQESERIVKITEEKMGKPFEIAMMEMELNAMKQLFCGPFDKIPFNAGEAKYSVEGRDQCN